MRIAISDVETERLVNPQKIWLCGGRVLGSDEIERFDNTHEDKRQKKLAEEWYRSLDYTVFHNGISFDGPVLNSHFENSVVNLSKIIDTYIVSRTIKFDRAIPKGCRKGPHSLEAWGLRLGIHKGSFDHFEDFEEYREEGIEYWEGDLDTTLGVFNHLKKYIFDPDWKKALRCEHDIQIELDKQKIYGFHFNKPLATELLSEVKSEMARLEEEIQEDYPPELTHVHTINYLIKKDGEEGSHVQNAKAKYPMTSLRGDKLECYDYVEFNPGSPKQRIEVLWEAGWKPFEKTKTHQKFSRAKVGQYWGKSLLTQELYNSKKEHFEYYGWTCGEDNLKTLPKKAPLAARKLARWMTLEGRRSSLVEWIGQVKEDDRIHGTVFGIGSWTGRMSHTSPNTANISSVWPEDKPVKSAVDEVKKRYDTAMRSCWDVPQGRIQVGTDMAGIQLRILADYLAREFDAHDYIKAIVAGKKEDETDIHNLNRKALGLSHIDRNDSKTFAYAYVLNAGIPKIASILRCSNAQATKARDNFERSIKGLKALKEEYLPSVASKGFFVGYDGRKVCVPSLHKTLAGILQNGESVVLKHWYLDFKKKALQDGLNFAVVGAIHDEIQCEVMTEEEALRLQEIQAESMTYVANELGFICPLEVESKTGRCWSECH